MKTITASEANRNFSKLLGEVERGETVTITSHGTPVARMVPANDEAAEETKRMDAARDRLLARLRSQPARNLGSWTRDELYDDADDFA